MIRRMIEDIGPRDTVLVWVAALLAVTLVCALFEWGERWRGRCYWRAEIVKREDYVARGCPDTERDEYGRDLLTSPMAYWSDVIGVRSLDKYPDLKARDIAAHKAAMAIWDGKRRR